MSSFLRRVLAPSLSRTGVLRCLSAAIVGTLLAATFGIVHDQITYTISPEYFTHFKFQQFAQVNPNGPPRLFVAVIGVLATWWVGLIAGWIIGRQNCRLPSGFTWQVRAQFFILLATTIIGSALGGIYGAFLSEISLDDLLTLEQVGITDPDAFRTVGKIHLGGYIGVVIGLFVTVAIDAKRPSEEPKL